MMGFGSSIEALHDALGAAIHRDISDIEYKDRDWVAYGKLSKEEKAEAAKPEHKTWISKTRRPYSDEVEVRMFSQTWGSTACGYGGMGGASMTTVYTVVIEHHRVFYVYFGCDRLAYKVEYNKLTDDSKALFSDDLHSSNMPSVQEAKEKYKLR